MIERKIMRQLKAGDQTIFENIIREYHSYVSTIVSSILYECLDEVDIQEIIQQVFYQLWSNREKIESEKYESIKNYIGAIARNLAINEKKRLKHDLPLDEHIVGTVNDTYSQIELRDVLLNAMKKIDKDCQIILLKFYFQRKTISQIAQEENITESSVKNKLKRSKERLKKILQEGGYVYDY